MSSRAFLLLLVAGCTGSGAARPATNATTTSSVSVDEEAVDDLLEHHRHHHGGLTMFVAMSIDTLGIAPARHARVDPIQSALYSKMSGARDAENAVDAVLAEGVAAGAIDRAKVDAAIDRLRVDAASVLNNASDAMNDLHAALDPAERMTLVDKVRAHWALWLRANPSMA